MASSCPSPTPDDVFVGDVPFSEYTQALLKRVVATTLASNALPLGNDHEFYRSYQSVGDNLTRQQERLLSMTQGLLRLVHAGTSGRVDLMVHGSHGEDDVDERYERLVDASDSLFERVDTIIDESILGSSATDNAAAVKRVLLPTTSISARPLVTGSAPKTGYAMLHAKNIVRPQLKWDVKVDNSNAPFVPLITYKPNATVTLEEVFSKHEAEQSTGSNGEPLDNAIATHMRDSLGIESNAPCDDSYPHPYGPELDAFVPAEWMLLDSEPQLYGSLDDTPFTYVDTVEDLQELKQTLLTCKEFAIDTEAHQYRSFSGFVCLMQISTRDEDFIVDTLALRSHMYMLNEPFTNPNIVKVLHGADSDIVWLQRDFGLYIVNMFDTGQAARVLEYPRFSLAYLLQHYCQVTADKKYQLADWRIRPLPAEMLKYAREDTHYLLYIYDRMRSELIERGNANKNFLHAVWNRSTELCRRRFEKERWRPTAYLELFHKYSRAFNATQLRVFKALYDWRDKVARLEDESVRYVLPNHMMFQTVRLMPSDATGVLACCNPVPPLVRLHATDLALLISTAVKEAESEEPLVDEADVLVHERQQTIVPGQHRVILSHHLYNPLGWIDNSAPPPTSIETRLNRCGPLFKSRESNIAHLLEDRTSQINNGNASKAARITASFTDLFAAFTASAAVTVAAASASASVKTESVSHTRADKTKEPETDTPSQNGDQSDGQRSKVMVLSEMGEPAGKKRKAVDDVQTPVANLKKAATAQAHSNAKAIAPAPKEDFVPFDYSSVSVPEEALPANADKQTQSSRKAGPKQSGAFNPHSAIEEAKFKKEPRANIAPKTGQRSMTYTYKK